MIRNDDFIVEGETARVRACALDVAGNTRRTCEISSERRKQDHTDFKKSQELIQTPLEDFACGAGGKILADDNSFGHLKPR